MKKEWVPERVWNQWDHINMWGNNLDFHFDKRYVIGHIPTRYALKDGHEFRCKMQSGKIARFRIKNVKYLEGVWDMLRFDLEDVGYCETGSQPVKESK